MALANATAVQELMNPVHSSAPSVPASAGDATAHGWQWHRERLRRYLTGHPVDEVSEEEIAAHFDGMPGHYWERTSETELGWGLQTVHRFLNGLVASANGGTPAIITWRHFPRLGCTKVLVATWDRAGLLTKIAGYTSALRLNIVRAEAFTRADNIVLDVFWLCDGNHKQITDVERLRQLTFLIDGGLSEPPRFVSAWACHSHKYLPRGERIRTIVTFDNGNSSNYTVLTVEASERLGLLHDMLHVLAEHEINICEALVDTVNNVARDIFYVTDVHKRKVTDAARLSEIEQAIVAAL